MQPLPASVLPAGVRARILPGINGLDIHVLEAGFEPKGRPAERAGSSAEDSIWDSAS